METNNRRMKYAYENEESTSEEESYADTDHVSSNKNEFSQRNSRSGRKPKCFTKNALLARENRLKKKMYLASLENDVTLLKHENKKLLKVVSNQSYLIADLKKQLKYFKSVVANSSDISKLIRNIHQTTGMSVCSSLEKNLSLKNVCVPKPIPSIARKTAHPWEEMGPYPTPEFNSFSVAETPSGDELTQFLNSMPLDFPLDIPEVQLMDNFPFRDNDVQSEYVDTLDDHNYTATASTDDNIDDVGVCLHVSKHRVSLEFCSSCSENATQQWPN